MVGEVGRIPTEEASLDETRIELLIPRRNKTTTKCVCLIKRDHRRHHVNNGLRADTGDGGAPVVLKFICDVAKERSQPLALAQELLWPRGVWRCHENAAECLPRIFGVVHPTSLDRTANENRHYDFLCFPDYAISLAALRCADHKNLSVHP